MGRECKTLFDSLNPVLQKAYESDRRGELAETLREKESFEGFIEATVPELEDRTLRAASAWPNHQKRVVLAAIQEALSEPDQQLHFRTRLDLSLLLPERAPRVLISIRQGSTSIYVSGTA